MEKRLTGFVLILTAIGALAFAAGVLYARNGQAEENPAATTAPKSAKSDKKVRVVYPQKTELDFEGMEIQGEMRNPGEFYFQRRPEEKFDSLVKRRANFHREMLRDAVVSK